MSLSVAGDRAEQCQQVPAVGRQPDAERLLLCGLLKAMPTDAIEVVEMVDIDDLHPVNASVLAAIRVALVESPEVYGPTTVLDILIRRGSSADVRKALVDAVSAGAANTSGALRHYAGCVVSAAWRRRIEGLGRALVAASSDGPDYALTGMVDAAAAAIRATSSRLLALRSETP